MEVASRLSHLGIQMRAAVAGTPDAARALARFSRVGIVPQGQDEAPVRKLPSRRWQVWSAKPLLLCRGLVSKPSETLPIVHHKFWQRASVNPS